MGRHLWFRLSGEVAKKLSTGVCGGAGAETEKALLEVETSLVCPLAVPASRGLVGEMVARIGLSHCLPQAAVPG